MANSKKATEHLSKDATGEPATWKIVLTPAALKMLQDIGDVRVRRKIVDRIDGLAHDPDKQGKALVAELAGYRSLRAVGQRYRIVYRMDGEIVVVTIVSIWIRKEGDKADIYRLTQKLLKLGLLETK